MVDLKCVLLWRLTLVADEYGSWTDTVLFGNTPNNFFSKQWTACTTKWAVRLYQYTLALAKLMDLLLGQVRVLNR